MSGLTHKKQMENVMKIGSQMSRLVLLMLLGLLPGWAQGQSMIAKQPVSDEALEQTPATVLYQGYLTDHNGEAFVDGPYEITFRLYDQDQAGKVLWTENPHRRSHGLEPSRYI